MKRLRNILAKALPLSLGLALSIILIAKICFDLSFDNFYKDHDRIYLIQTGYVIQGKSDSYNQISGGVAPGFRQYVPGVEEATRISTIFYSPKYRICEDGTVISAEGESIIADTSFFRIFDRKILYGNPGEILDIPKMAMVSSSFAEKLGGIEKAVGSRIVNADAPDTEIIVGGVFEDFPKNGMMDIDVMISMPTYSSWSTNNWVGNDRYAGYVKLAEGIDPSSLGDAIRLMQEKNQPLDQLEQQGIKLWYTLTPVSKLHTSDKDVRNSMILLSIIVVLLLSVSILNYLLSVISKVVERSKEFATRKCFGAEGKEIYGMLFREAAITTLCSLIIASVILAAGRGMILDIMGVSFSDMMVPMSYIATAAVAVSVFVLTAVIPGRIYMKIPVASALRKFSDSKRRWKYILLTSQFTINAFLFGMLIIFNAQYGKVTDSDPGYDYDNVMYIYTGGMKQGDIMTAAGLISKVSGVEQVVLSCNLPFEWPSGNNISIPGKEGETLNVADQYFCSKGFFDFFRIPFIEGREPSSQYEVAVSRSFVEKMEELAGWNGSAIGKEVIISEHSDSGDTHFTICGVYEDYLIGSFNNRDDRPSIRFLGDENSYLGFSYILVKAARISPEIMDRVSKAFLQASPESLNPEVFSYEDEMRNSYSDNRKMRDTFTAGSLFALLISVFGLIGYISNESERRSKEIAVRKINGARACDIVSMFIKDSLKMAAVAAVVADVLIWLAASRYLEQFDVRVSLSPVYFIAADLILAIIVTATVAFNSIRIAMSNPVESIKNE